MTVTDDNYDKLRIKDEQEKKKDPKNVKRGKKARKDGKAFEVLVRKELTDQGWIVCRFDNQVDLNNLEDEEAGIASGESHSINSVEDGKTVDTKLSPIKIISKSIGKLTQSKGKFNPFTRSMMMVSGGFPDFICIQGNPNYLRPVFIGNNQYEYHQAFKVQLVECKINGYLDPTERQKVEWIKTNLKIPVIVASKIKEGRKTVIVYEEK